MSIKIGVPSRGEPKELGSARFWGCQEKARSTAPSMRHGLLSRVGRPHGWLKYQQTSFKKLVNGAGVCFHCVAMSSPCLS